MVEVNREQKIRHIITIEYTPKRDDYKSYEDELQGREPSIYDMAKIDSNLLKTGELLPGDFNEDEIKMEWVITSG